MRKFWLVLWHDSRNPKIKLEYDVIESTIQHLNKKSLKLCVPNEIQIEFGRY